MKGTYLRPTDVSVVESQQWRTTLGKKGPPPKYDTMDLKAIRIDTLTAKEKTKLQKEGKCFFCK
jgi:hypothetical protein